LCRPQRLPFISLRLITPTGCFGIRPSIAAGLAAFGGGKGIGTPGKGADEATTLFIPAYHRRLRKLAIDRDVSMQTLILDAIDMLMEREGQGAVERWEMRRKRSSAGRCAFRPAVSEYALPSDPYRQELTGLLRRKRCNHMCDAEGTKLGNVPPKACWSRRGTSLIAGPATCERAGGTSP
jgi:hypothetical protein